MATRDDATVLLQLLSWGTATGRDGATQKFFTPEVKTNPTTDEDVGDPDVGTVLSYGETTATLVKHGVLGTDLVRDLIWIEGIWTRLGPYALAIRKGMHEPRLYENVEAFASAQ